MVHDAVVAGVEDRVSAMADQNSDEEQSQSSYSNNEQENDENNAPECYRDNEEVNNEIAAEESNSSSATDTYRCLESIPPSDSDKENFSGQQNIPCEILAVEYEKTDLIPLPELLKIHPKQLVSGFEYGEATKRQAQENMKLSKDRNENCRNSESEQTETEFDQPCCSKTISEEDHKTPHSLKRTRAMAESRKKMSATDIEFCKTTRGIPECLLDYPDCIEVWVYMIYKEEAAQKFRNPRLFNDFKSVTPRMRAILLDWLMEVAAVYHLRRVTYYLSVDYFDRFLSIRPDIPKSLLQLVGITCLYIAAKVEEVYPPNLSEFSYVCDGACKSKEMVSCELLILNSLGWEVIMATPTDWLNLYMQLHHKSQEIVKANLSMDFNKDFLFPQFSSYQFTRASQLIDLLSLDPGFLKFSYSTIAATAMYFMYDKEIALGVSGLTWEQMKPCAEYTEIFYEIIKDAPDPRLHSCLGTPHPDDVNKVSTGLLSRMRSGPKNENYSFQTHVANMEYFERATIFRLSCLRKERNEHANGNTGHHEDSTKGPGNDESDNKELTYLDESELIDSLTKPENVEKERPEEESPENLLSLDDMFELLLNQSHNYEDDVENSS